MFFADARCFGLFLHTDTAVVAFTETLHEATRALVYFGLAKPGLLLFADADMFLGTALGRKEALTSVCAGLTENRFRTDARLHYIILFF